MSTKNSLAAVPAEIENMIIAELEPFAAINLRQTNRYYSQVVSLQRLDQDKYRNYLHRHDEGKAQS